VGMNNKSIMEEDACAGRIDKITRFTVEEVSRLSGGAAPNRSVEGHARYAEVVRDGKQ